MATLDLSGDWRAAPADETLRRAYPDPQFDDGRWEPIGVPGHWRSSTAFADENGPLLYRRAFDATPTPGARSWLRLDGVFYQSDVWLDGEYLTDTEGWFFPHVVEVSDALASRREHVLAIEVASPRAEPGAPKRSLTGAFDAGELVDPGWNAGGIWRGVWVEETGPVRIKRWRAVCTEASEESATISFTATLDTLVAEHVELATNIGESEHVEKHQLAAGHNELAWQVTVDRPALWWPHALGEQPLTDLVVEVRVGDGRVSDRRAVRTGLRKVRMENWILSVNGERLFLKGSNLGPTRQALAEPSAEEVEHDVALARRAGLDLLRVHTHVARPELYDAADRLGMLLWQDLPLHGLYARGTRKQAARQAREAVDLLGHHPSVAVWCGHHQPSPPGQLLRQQLPTWNKTVLDSGVKRALERADPSRPVIAHSGVAPHAGSGGTDSHLSFGWQHGDADDLADLAARFPRMVRFVSQLGAQAVPSSAEFLAPWDWPGLDWELLAGSHHYDAQTFDRLVPPSAHSTFESWQKASQTYQADLLRRQLETLRRLKYRPSGGFCQFHLADAHPAISSSVLDHERVPKPGYEAMAAACAPVIVVADPPDRRYGAGDRIGLDVHVVSDLRVGLVGALVTATLTWPGGEATWRWEGDLEPDCCARVGRVDLVAPDTTGRLELHLGLEHAQVKATNRYVSSLAD